MSDYAIRSAEGYEPDKDENILSSIFKQYESVIVQSLITSFGLDFLLQTVTVAMWILYIT